MRNRLTRRTILQALPGMAAAVATPLAPARDIPALNLEGPGIPKIGTVNLRWRRATWARTATDVVSLNLKRGLEAPLHGHRP